MPPTPARSRLGLRHLMLFVIWEALTLYAIRPLLHTRSDDGPSLIFNGRPFFWILLACSSVSGAFAVRAIARFGSR